MNITKHLGDLMIKLNKKYFLAILTTLWIQLALGVNLANALACEKEMIDAINEAKDFTNSRGNTYTGTDVTYNYATNFTFTDPSNFWPKLKVQLDSYGSSDVYTKSNFQSKNEYAKENFNKHLPKGSILEICYTQAMVDANADIDSIINGTKANKSSNSGSSSQTNSNKKSNFLCVSHLYANMQM